MEKVTGLVTRISRLLDQLAGLCFVLVMSLVVMNILLRVLFKTPILGAYEIVGYLTAIGIGLALASCAVQNGHIAVDLVINRLPCKLQATIDTLMNLIAFCFWGLAAWHLGKYAQEMTVSKVVAATTRIPLYPIIYLIALSVLGLCLVLMVKMFNSFKKAVA
jgi:TRAP-type C4-dicarboxylate transport system permease small subunit